MNEEELKNKYMEMQLLDNQLKQLQEGLMQIDQQLMELMVIKDSLEQLPKAELGSEVLVPVSQGIYVKSSLKANNKVIINVGAGTAVAKSVGDAKAMLDDKTLKVKEMQAKIMADFQSVSSNMEAIEKEVMEEGD